MKRRFRKYWRWILLSLAMLSLLFCFIARQLILNSTRAGIYFNITEVPHKSVALVLGTKVLPDGHLGTLAQERADAAMALYRSGTVQKILISGDHGHKAYDEVNTIRNYMLGRGLPPQDVFMDHAGFDTYSSMYRARDVFVARDIVIVSQAFHLPRAVFIAKALGLNAVGLAADGAHPHTSTFSALREWPAAAKAFLEADVFKPKPHFLGPIIPITGDGRLTEDHAEE